MEYEHSQAMLHQFELTQFVLRQPHAYMHPKIFKDGDKWCALYGTDIMEGVAAFGDTPEKAAQGWDLVWLNGDNLNHVDRGRFKE